MNEVEIDVSALELLPAETADGEFLCTPAFTCGTTTCGETRVVE